MYDLIDHSPSPAGLNQTDPDASHVAINLVNRRLLLHFNTCVKLHLLFIYFFMYTYFFLWCEQKQSGKAASYCMWRTHTTHTQTNRDILWIGYNENLNLKLSEAIFPLQFIWSHLGTLPLTMQEKCTNTHIYSRPMHTHTRLTGGISVSSNLWYEIFITTLCAQLQCHALSVGPGFDVRLVIRTHTISLTLGVKVFFPRWRPTSPALLRFSISLSVALPLGVFSLFSCPVFPPPSLFHFHLIYLLCAF